MGPYAIMRAATLATSLELLRLWAAETHAEIGSDGLFVFGSSIYADGCRFEAQTSDFDLLVRMPPVLRSADARAEWIRLLQHSVESLEASLLNSLGRSRADEPICSVVAVTEFEVQADVHKSQSPGFFARNTFRNLIKDLEDGPLWDAGSLPSPAPGIGRAVGFAQKIRNLYLSTTPNGSRMLSSWTGDGAVPKEAARAAAGVAPLMAPPIPGEEFDTRLGVEHLAHWLYENRSRSGKGDYYRLYDWLAARRDGRGAVDDPNFLTPDQYLLLAEIIYDIATEHLGANAVHIPSSMAPGTEPRLSSFSEIEAADDRRTAATSKRFKPVFVISDKERLVGTDDEVDLAVEEATYNLKHREEPAFHVAFAEALELAETISANEGKEDVVSRRAVVHAADRQKLLALRAPSYLAGFRFILFYQNLLFPDKSRVRDVRLALDGFTNRVRINVARVGGILDGWNQLDKKRVVVSFSIGSTELNRYLRERNLDGPLHLAAENQPLRTLEAKLRARFFVPELVYDYVVGGEHELPSAAQEECELFTMDYWHLGVH
jgi:hypothetical protein